MSTKKLAKNSYDSVADSEKERKIVRNDFSLTSFHAYLKLKIAGIRESSNLLDVGCGEGFDLIGFNLQGIKTVGLDISLGMLNICRGRLLEQSIIPMLICADAENLPIKDSIFNVVHSRELSSFNNLSVGGASASSDPLIVLREIKRILKPGGLVMTMLPLKDYPGSNFKPTCEDELKYVYRQAGIEFVDSIYPMPSVFFKIFPRLFHWIVKKWLKHKSYFIIAIGRKS